MPKIKFYTKSGCWYCDQAEEMLKGFEVKLDLDIERIDITLDDDLYDLYREDVPVVEYEDGHVLYKYIKRKWFIEALEKHSNKD